MSQCPCEQSQNQQFSRSDLIRVGIVGFGKMGGIHLRTLRQLAFGDTETYYKCGLSQLVQQVQVCGVCDIRTRDDLQLAAGIPLYDTVGELLSAEKPDLVVIASPAKTHYDLAMACLRAGVHTFVEKPIVTRSSELADLVTAARDNQCCLMAGHVERYNPVAVKLKSMLQAGEMVPESYLFRRTQPGDPRIEDCILVDKVVHDLDLALSLFGPISQAELADVQIQHGRIESARVELRHENGVSGSLYVSWLDGDSAKKTRTIQILLESGEGLFGSFWQKILMKEGVPIDCTVPSWVRSDNNQVKDELADFIFQCFAPTDDASLPAPLIKLPEVEACTSILEKLIEEGEHLKSKPEDGEHV